MDRRVKIIVSCRICKTNQSYIAPGTTKSGEYAKFVVFAQIKIVICMARYGYVCKKDVMSDTIPHVGTKR